MLTLAFVTDFNKDSSLIFFLLDRLFGIIKELFLERIQELHTGVNISSIVNFTVSFFFSKLIFLPIRVNLNLV